VIRVAQHSHAAAAFFAEHHAAWLKGGAAPDAHSIFSEDQGSLWSELEAAGLARRANADGSSWQLTDAGQRGT
jgi:hypothetical protein